MKKCLIFAVMVFIAAPVFGQTPPYQAPRTAPAIVVSSCGTAPTGWPGSTLPSPVVVDVNGNTCVSVVSAPTIKPCYVQSGTGTTNDTTNHANCTAAPTTFMGIRAINTTGTLAYIKLYNLATNPTCSSATGLVEIIPVPASTTGAGFIDLFSTFPYSIGFGYCVVGGATSTDNSAPPAGVFITLGTSS